MKVQKTLTISLSYIYTQKMNDKKTKCLYKDPEGFTCDNDPEFSGYCYWHDVSIDKTDDTVKTSLEAYAKQGGMLRGISLKHADLSGIDLVNHHKKNGYDFSYADLYRSDLKDAHLFNIKLDNASLMKANLQGANLNCGQLNQTNLLGAKWSQTKIEHTNFGSSLIQEYQGKYQLKQNNTDKANDYFEQAEEIYRDIRKHAEREGIFTLSGAFIHKELTMRRLQQPLFSMKRFSSKMVDLFCGYGEDPLRIILLSMIMILICSILYAFMGLNYHDELYVFSATNSFSHNIHIFLSCLYYSVVTFTTLGYGDFTPIGISRGVAAIEAFTGSFTIALFVVVFVKKMTR